MNIALIFDPGMMLEEASPVFLLTLLAKSALLKEKKESLFLSSCSGSRLQPFHADD